MLKACNELSQAPLYIDDSSDLGMLELRAKARRLHSQEQARGGLGLVIVDYLQLMRAEDPRQNRVEQVAQISRGLKILARELEVPVIGISQLSRAPEQRPDKRPILSDLRESGQIEQDADLVAFIYRDEYYNRDESEEKGIAEIIIAKHRNGPTALVKLVFLDHYPRFADRAREDQAGGRAGRGRGPGSRRGFQRRGDGGSRRSSTTPSRPRSGLFPNLPAGRLRRVGLDPRAGKRGAALRLPRAHGRAGARARRRFGDPGQVPRRRLRPPAGHGDRADGRPRRAQLLRVAGREPRRRQGPLADGRRRHRQDDAGDARLQDGAGGRALGRDLLAAEDAGADPPHLRRRRRRAVLPRVLRAADRRSTCSTSTTSAPRSAATGSSSSSTRSSTSATRPSARSS